MTRLLLVRHAEAAGGEDVDPGLSDLGVRQTRALAARLATLRPAVILHGPRRRVAATAAILADALDVPADETADLDDRTPVPSADRRGDYAAHRLPRLEAVPEDERDEDGADLTAAWERLRSRTDGTTAVLVTHAFVVSWFVTVALGAPVATWMRLPVANGGLTVLARGGADGLVLESFNDVGHLPAETI